MAIAKLNVYRDKRDFSRTAEPSGDRRVREAEYPRFVIQKRMLAAITSRFGIGAKMAGAWAASSNDSW